MTIKKSIIAVTVSAFAAISAAPAFAADNVTFEYSKTELTSSKRVEKLYDRINVSARKLCTDTGTRGIRSFQNNKACTEDLVNDFVSGIDNRKLTAMHTDEVSGDRYANNER